MIPLPDGAWHLQLGIVNGVRHDRGLEPHAAAPTARDHMPRMSASLQVALREGELRTRGLLDVDMLTPAQVGLATRILRRRM